MPTDEPLRGRVIAAMALPPLSEMGEAQRCELAVALRKAGKLEDLPGKWQAAIVRAEQGAQGSRPSHSSRCCEE